MNLTVRHELQYTYSNFVSLTPHTLHLHPPTNPFVRLERHTLRIDPQPDRLVVTPDVEGNVQHVLFHNQPTDHLHIVAEMEATLVLENPFDFILYPVEAQRLPMVYDEKLRRVLHPYLQSEGITTLVEQFARQMAAEAGWETLAFLTHLNEYIRRNFAYEIRETGQPLPPEHVLIQRKGSCRDYVNLYMAVCRVVGIAARFVSGYHFGELRDQQELHAWAEVYLPGAGWRGFDPTNNITVADQHLPLASSAVPTLVTPVSGSFSHRGQTHSTLQTTISVQPVTLAPVL